MCAREKEAILKELGDLRPSSNVLRILLYGPVGAGKSCFINSVQRALLGRNAMVALENTERFGKSFTRTITTHKLKKRGGGHYPFVLTDIMGLEMDGGILTEDIMKVLEGRILDGYKFDSQAPITWRNSKYNKNPSICDKVHCLVSIIPADSISRMDHTVIDKMKAVRQKAGQMRIPQVIVLTKVDKTCEMVNKDLRKLFHSSKIKEKAELGKHELDIPWNNIYPVKNYHAEIIQDTDIDALILMTLRDIVNFASDHVEDVY
ncbi:interferon-induced protein 44-like isoform X2 [Colossoma macropomum]|uniref:interferon-induced protein 44-like isoform X2 n=1 Tax=Colossoma macropomum TaxID=42526 RepID=UPI001863B255|nr:interferon-induced protein 44-like isoform X2 [Colossoma macropomum]